MPAVPREIVWEISQRISDGAVPPELIQKSYQVLKDHVIELMEKPSARPGVDPLVTVHPDGSETEQWFKGASPKQLQFQKKFFERKGKERLSPVYYCIAGGNRASKSVCVWAMCFCKDIRDYAKSGETYWAIAPTEDKLVTDAQEWVWRYLPRSMFGTRVFSKEIGFGGNRTVELILPDNRGTCKLTFLTERQMETSPHVFEASSVSGIAWTEARYEPLVDALRTRVIDKRGYILVDYLPCEGWHTHRFQDNPGVFHMTLGMRDNAHNLPPGEIDKYAKENAHDPDLLALRIDGKPRAMMGLVIKSFDRTKHVIPKFDIPPWWPLYMAADWGFEHPHAFVLATVAPNNAIYIIDEEYRNKMSVEETVLACWEMVGRWRKLDHGEYESPKAMFKAMRQQLVQKQLREQRGWELDTHEVEPLLVSYAYEQWNRVLARACIIDNQIFQRRGDNASMTLATQFREIGFPVSPAIKGEIDWSVETLRRKFYDDKMFLFDNCLHIRRDLSSWKYKSDVHGRAGGARDKYEEAYKDGVDPLRYLVQVDPKHHVESDMEMVGV